MFPCPSILLPHDRARNSDNQNVRRQHGLIATLAPPTKAPPRSSPTIRSPLHLPKSDIRCVDPLPLQHPAPRALRRSQESASHRIPSATAGEEKGCLLRRPSLHACHQTRSSKQFPTRSRSRKLSK